MQRSTVRLILLVLVPLLLLASCASNEVVVEKVPEMYWPLPPEKPRIKFVDVIIGSLDARMKKGKLKELLLGQEADTLFVKPFGVAAAGNRLYVTEVGGVYYYDFEKMKFKVIGVDKLRVPTAIAASHDFVVVGDIASKRLLKFDRDGQFISEFAGKEIDTPAGLAIDGKRQRIIYSDAKKNEVTVFRYDGSVLFSFGRTGTREGEFHIPYGVAVDPQGRIYVVDSANFRLQIFDENGKYLKSIGKVGMSAGQFARPKGVALDSDGHIYVLDAAFGNFQIFDFDGNTLLAVGNNGIGPAEFQLPSAIAINEKDEIYVVDQINRRVQIFQYLK